MKILEKLLLVKEMIKLLNWIQSIFLIFVNIKMTQYSSLNVKLLNSKLNKFKSAIKNETEVVLRLSANRIGHDELIFLISYY